MRQGFDEWQPYCRWFHLVTRIVTLHDGFAIAFYCDRGGENGVEPPFNVFGLRLLHPKDALTSPRRAPIVLYVYLFRHASNVPFQSADCGPRFLKLPNSVPFRPPHARSSFLPFPESHWTGCTMVDLYSLPGAGGVESATCIQPPFPHPTLLNIPSACRGRGASVYLC